MTTDVDVLKCPSCGSSDVTKAKGWTRFVNSVIVFGVCLLLAATTPDDRLNAGSQAIAVIMFLAGVYYLIIGLTSKNQCKPCGNKW